MIKHNFCANISADAILVYEHIKWILSWILILLLYSTGIALFTAIVCYGSPKRPMTFMQLVTKTFSQTQYVSSDWWVNYWLVLIFVSFMIIAAIATAVGCYKLTTSIRPKLRCYRINVRDALIQKKLNHK